MILKTVYNKKFLIIFAVLSAANIMEDMVWAIVARYTTIHLLFIIVGIISWSFITAIIIRYWGGKTKK